MKLIPLTQGQFAQVDDEDYDYLMQWKWYYWKAKENNTGYAKRSDYKNRKSILMHRQILGLTKRNDFGDHKDRNGLNCQRNNLRISTCSQNNSNLQSVKNSTSKYLGVYLHQNKNNWIAQITKNYKQKYIGCFATEIEAAKAYDIEAIKIHGEFANPNFKV